MYNKFVCKHFKKYQIHEEDNVYKAWNNFQNNTNTKSGQKNFVFQGQKNNYKN